MQETTGYLTTADGVRLFFHKLGSGPNTAGQTVAIIPNAVHMIDSFRHLADGRTVIFFDLRHRGNSDSVSDREKLSRGIHHDVDDIEAVRQHFEIGKVDLIGHSYVGLMVILYALKYPNRVNRIVQIGPAQPDAGTQYPTHLTGADATMAEFGAKLAQMRMEPPPEDPKEACAKFWALMRGIMVANPADAGRIQWTPCDYPNELGFMRHWMANVMPSIQGLHLTDEELLKMTAPVLTIHGARDRQAPYGGGREWAMKLPDARLLTVENAAHVPWIEEPEKVFESIETFLGGSWPEAAQKVGAVDPDPGA